MSLNFTRLFNRRRHADANLSDLTEIKKRKVVQDTQSFENSNNPVLNDSGIEISPQKLNVHDVEMTDNILTSAANPSTVEGQCNMIQVFPPVHHHNILAYTEVPSYGYCNVRDYNFYNQY